MFIASWLRMKPIAPEEHDALGEHISLLGSSAPFWLCSAIKIGPNGT